MKTLSQLKVVVGILDNAQKVKQLKYQRIGQSAKFSLLTARAFTEPYIPPSINDINFPAERVDLLYINQPIPSPDGMPAFETLGEPKPEHFLSDIALDHSDDIDMSGER
eukprot:5396263-Ditylum_brightwellii.AAC.1